MLAGHGDGIGEHVNDVEMDDRLAGTGQKARFGGRTNLQDVERQVHDDLAQAGTANNQYGSASAALAGSNYDQPNSRLGGFYGRVAAGFGRPEVKTVLIKILKGLLVAAVLATPVLIWYFAFGPGRDKKPTPKDDNKDNVPRGPGPVEVDVLFNDENTENTSIRLVGADSSGVLTQPSIGKWSVTTGDPAKVSFTPDPAYNFNTPATATYILMWAGVASDAATITITYQPAVQVSMPDPSSDGQRGDFATPVKFDIKNTSGKVVLVDPDAGSASTQTVPEGVWTILSSSTVQFLADPSFVGYRVQTDIQVDYGTQLSKSATLSVLFNQPVAGEVFIQGLTPGSASPTVDVVIRSHAIAPNTLDPKSVKLTGVQDMETGPLPASVDLSKDGKRMSANGQGVWMVADDGHVAFVPEQLKLVTSFTPAADRDDYDGYVGMAFDAAGDHTLKSLGIRKGTGATGNWSVYLTDIAGKILATAAIDLTAGTVGTFYYGPVNDYQLKGGSRYHLFAKVASNNMQYWANDGGITLDPSIASNPSAIFTTDLVTIMGGGSGRSYVGVDFTVAGFVGSPTPATYTIADNKKNTSNTALIILNYAASIDPADVNDPVDKNFFAHLRIGAFDPSPALSHKVLLAALIPLVNMTATLLPAPGASPIDKASFDTRYTTFKSKGATPDDLWNVCADIDAKLVDPKGVQPKLYSRYWRLATMRDLLDRLVTELGLK